MSSDKFKQEILKGEKPYNPEAWNSLSKKLDILMPVKKASFFSAKNIFIGLGAAVILSIIIFNFSGTENKTKNSQANTPKNEQVVSEEKNQDSNSETDFTEKNKSLETATSTKIENKTISLNNEVKSNKTNSNSEIKISAIELKESENLSKPNQVVATNLNVNTSFILPKTANLYCLNSDLSIQNKNDGSLFLINENSGKSFKIEAKKSLSIQLKEAGNYIFQFEEKGSIKVDKAFSVPASKPAPFEIESEITYEKGIPYIRLKASEFNSNYKWSTNKGLIQNQSENTKLRVLTKGQYKVSLESKDENNCFSEKVESIQIEEDYNLLAPTGFIPTDIDPRNNRFIPYALTKRDVQFEMQIIDPTLGRVVYKCNSTDNPWDGIDQNSGQMIDQNKSYIWRVLIKNPLPGEKQEYTGTITRL